MPIWLGELAVVGDDLVEHRLVVADQVHLVDRQHEVADADQVREVAVAPGLHEHALARVDQDHGEVGGRGAGHHVARVLLVARRVGDDELALLGGEEAIGDVDRDALLALGGEAVDAAARSRALALRADRLLSASSAASWSSKIIFESYSRRPISVDLPSSTEPQVMKRSRSCAGAIEIGLDVLGDEARQTWAIRSSPPASSSPSRRLVVVDRAALALARWWSAASPGSLRQRRGLALDRAGQRIAAERAEADRAHHRLFAGLAAESGRRRPSAASRRARTVGRGAAK